MISLQRFFPRSVKRLLRRMVLSVAYYSEGLASTIRDRFLEDKGEIWEFRRCLTDGKPYFGPVMASRQGVADRHGYMQGIIEMECSGGDKAYYRILEIGSWAGGSAITWSDAIKKFNGGNGSVICVDPWIRYTQRDFSKAKVCEIMDEALKTGEIIDLFFHNIRASGHEDVVRLIKGRSDEILPLLRPNQFDLAFVDGNHSYQQVLKDLENATPLVRDGGILCGDDLELQVPVIDVKHAKRNSEVAYLLDPKSNEWFHPGVTLAVADWFGAVSAWEGFWAMRKRGHGWEKVVSEKLDLKDVRVPEHLM